MNEIEKRRIFTRLFEASYETAVNELFANSAYSQILIDPDNWYPLGGNESNFGVIENQQSSPIAALIEKITNSIDAILMRKCLEAGIAPKSPQAPKSMEEACETFWPRHHGEHNYYNFRNFSEHQREQAKSIQIVASGPKRDTSLVIYDDGEGQHPEDFEATFLSLLRGNKSEIHFVQGKYNMGGTGAIVFCGKKRYQLIASKRYDGTGKFGFTLVREHPLTVAEEAKKRATWYEYLKIDGEIPAFEIDELDIGLEGRTFTTGTIIKLYSYALPPGHVPINRGLNQSINEFLFDPALPISLKELPERYPNDNAPFRHTYGLKRRLEGDDSRNKYMEDVFSESDSCSLGDIKVTVYLFKNRAEGKDVKETRQTIQSEFFKNNMAVLFSLNGQVHGHYTSEFITRRLKMPLFRDHLLIHVDCTRLKHAIRKELFMASRDRLKGSDETEKLRTELTRILNGGRLKELHKQRKEMLSISSGDTQDLLKSFTKSMPLNSDFMRLLSHTFKLDDTDKNKPSKKDAKKKHANEDEPTPFNPQRYPSFLNLPKTGSEEKPAAQIPLDGTRSIKLLTDVEDNYFDRSDDPGELQISLLSHKTNETTGGNAHGNPKELGDLVNVTASSPSQGKIRISFSPTQEVQVDDAIQVNAILKGAGEDFEQAFWVKIVEKEKPKEPAPQKEKEEPQIGLPQFQLVYENPHLNHKTWEQLEDLTGQVMDFHQILHPYVEDGKLETIFINMDSHVLKTHKSSLKTPEQLELADKKYISSVYFHALFLFMITKNRGIEVRKENESMEISDYIRDLFSNSYGDFLLNFGTTDLSDTLSV